MVDIVKDKISSVKPKAVKKPPTQTAGVAGIDGHGAMGAAPVEPVEFQQYVDWQKLVNLPAFEMFVYEQSGFGAGSSATEWVASRRLSISDEVLYNQYADWHNKKGLWLNESPTGRLI